MTRMKTPRKHEATEARHSLERLVRRLADAERGLEQTIEDRDAMHLMADKLAGAIADFTGEDIGEHSSANCPWTNALDALAAMKPPNEKLTEPAA